MGWSKRFALYCDIVNISGNVVEHWEDRQLLNIFRVIVSDVGWEFK